MTILDSIIIYMVMGMTIALFAKYRAEKKGIKIPGINYLITMLIWPYTVMLALK